MLLGNLGGVGWATVMNRRDSQDALADVLKTISLNGSTYFCSDFTGPWGMQVEPGPEGLFHVVVEGQCWLQTSSGEPFKLDTGDIVAFPTGGAHWIGDTPESPRLPGNQVVESILGGGNPFQPANSQAQQTLTQNTLLCGSFSYDSSIDHPFLKDLPCFIHISAQQTPELAWLRSLINVLSNESRNITPGSSIMVDKLTEILFIQLMRFHMHKKANQLGYIAALADSQIGKALNLIHGEARAHLTVERLGNAVALSRTAFTDKFSRMVGMAPKSYLVNWRMQKARSQLQSSDLSMFEIAEMAGYSSEAAFSKAFKQFFDIPPGQSRRQTDQ